MERIIIIGCGGAGKSTLARRLGEKLGLPVVHLDKLWWREGWTHIAQEEFDAALLAEVQKDCWIIDGNYNRSMPMRLQYCDTIIYLDFSRIACLTGVCKRILTSYGTVRPDMGEGCCERIDFEFLKWVWNFNARHREKYYKMLNETENVETIVLKNRRAVKKFWENIAKK